MARYKPDDSGQDALVPVCFDKQILPGTFEYALHRLLESKIDLSAFDQYYQNDATGASAYHPRVLLKIILLSYSRGLMSSRQHNVSITVVIMICVTALAGAFTHTPERRFAQPSDFSHENGFRNCIEQKDTFSILRFSQRLTDGEFFTNRLPVLRMCNGTFGVD